MPGPAVTQTLVNQLDEIGVDLTAEYNHVASEVASKVTLIDQFDDKTLFEGSPVEATAFAKGMLAQLERPGLPVETGELRLGPQ